MSEQRAVVWDLDGVMVDSADAHNRSWVAMAKHFDVPYDPDRDFAGIFGRHNNDIISSMWQVTNQAQIALRGGTDAAAPAWRWWKPPGATPQCSTPQTELMPLTFSMMSNSPMAGQFQ